MAKKILLIDDDELITKSLSILLNKKGYETITARNAGEALEKVKEADFGLIICDVRMPVLDGIETIKQIRAYLNQSNKDLIPEILISGYADQDKYEKALSLKVAGYLFKPLDNDEFLQAVQKLIIK